MWYKTTDSDADTDMSLVIVIINWSEPHTGESPTQDL